MVVCWKMIITLFLLYTVVIDGNRVRRSRRQTLDRVLNSINQKPLLPNPRIFHAQKYSYPQQDNKNEIVLGKKDRRYHPPNQDQHGYGTIQGINFPYAGIGVGPYQYGQGQYGQGQGQGQYGYYSGYNSANFYNRPGYDSSNYNPSWGGNQYGGHRWNDGQKQNTNMFVVFLSLLVSLVIHLSLQKDKDILILY
ncbi:unnamed protein product [Rotaria sp. Silwood1]|nr:unnamed protein product [Rotaria sp. Silwood1]CAF1523187.1 unnamed protein product [Rotaria sp. Silwood1]CAF3677471.1 unnamed protein product [Rotaria sp. Silwood1]CAF3679228.1 unnamed protein product [Rotaria sp. Silwood1]CAF3775926.1 unnamed protein product [Rotaria sp. Silwood1]